MRKICLALPIAALLASSASAGSLSALVATTDFSFSNSAATGPVSLSNLVPAPGAIASADYGQLKVATFSGLVPGPVITSVADNQTASALFVDSATVGMITTPIASLTFTFTLDGSESGGASGSGLSFGLFEFILNISQGGGPASTFHARRERTTTAGGTMESATVAYAGGGPVEVGVAALFSTWTLVLPFVGSDPNISISGSALCHSAYQNDVPNAPGDGGTCDAAHTITWGGVSSGINQNGQPFTGLSLIGSNGFNYAQSYGAQSGAIPEPMSLALLGCGLAMAGAAHRRRRAA